jgi:hypothetical protein
MDGWKDGRMDGWMDREMVLHEGVGNGTIEGKRNSIGNIKEGDRVRGKNKK